MAKIYRTGIVGLGQIAYEIDKDLTRPVIWSHAKAYAVHPQTQIAAICDADGTR